LGELALSGSIFVLAATSGTRGAHCFSIAKVEIVQHIRALA
jgi:hypothetical protein